MGITETFRCQYIPFHIHTAKLSWVKFLSWVKKKKNGRGGEGLSGGLGTKAGLFFSLSSFSNKKKEGIQCEREIKWKREGSHLTPSKETESRTKLGGRVKMEVILLIPTPKLKEEQGNTWKLGL